MTCLNTGAATRPPKYEPIVGSLTATTIAKRGLSTGTSPAKYDTYLRS